MVEDLQVDLPRLGRFVRQRRISPGLTQTQLGQSLGWAQERVSLLENGRYGLPSLPQLTRLAEALSAPLNEVLREGGITVADSPATDDSRRPEQIRTLSREVVALIDKMGAVEGRVHDAERTLHEAESAQTKVRRQRLAMKKSLTGMSRENPTHQT